MQLQSKLWQRVLVVRHRKRRQRRVSTNKQTINTGPSTKENGWSATHVVQFVNPWKWWALSTCVFCAVIGWAAWTASNRALPELSVDPDLASATWIGEATQSNDIQSAAFASPSVSETSGPGFSEFSIQQTSHREVIDAAAPPFPVITPAGHNDLPQRTEATQQLEFLAPGTQATNPVIETAAPTASSGVWFTGTIEEVE